MTTISKNIHRGETLMRYTVRREGAPPLRCAECRRIARFRYTVRRDSDGAEFIIQGAFCGIGHMRQWHRDRDTQTEFQEEAN